MFTGTTSDQFEAYSLYHAELQAALTDVLAGNMSGSRNTAGHLDGLAYQRLRHTIPLEVRRASSTFFTSSSLRARLLSPYRDLLSRGASVLDPACGTGDLLIAALDLLPDHWSASRLRRHVAARFNGRELIPILAAVACDRLQLAVNVAPPSNGKPGRFSLPLVQAGDGLAPDVPYAAAQLVLLNPPFKREVLPRSTQWAEGLTSQAAPFTLHVLERCRGNTHVAAILPDVLRSGTRYTKWRAEIEKIAAVDKIELVGLFDPWTDIDVFIAHLRKHSRKGSSAPSSQAFDWHGTISTTFNPVTLGSVASISIGDVVPHRHPEEGPEVPYLTVHTAPLNTTITTAPTRKFAGRLHKPPFIVVRRTSAPTRAGGPRIASSIVHTNLGDVAVENHLIIIKPHTGTLASCRLLREQLADPSVTAWLDNRLRTRHLTKQALLELPLQSQANT